MLTAVSFNRSNARRLLIKGGMNLRVASLPLALALTLAGCQRGDRDQPDAAGGAVDGGTVVDGGLAEVSTDDSAADEGTTHDAAGSDSGTGEDGAGPSDTAGPSDAGPTDAVGPVDSGGASHFTRCLDVQGPRGCCDGSINYYFENGRVVTRECVAPQGCGYLQIAPGEFGYRCGGTGAPAADFIKCGYTRKSEAVCAALGQGAATSPDAIFPCGTAGLKCEIGGQFCGLYSSTVHPDMDMCVPLPARCASQNATCADCEPIQPRPWALYRCDDVKPGAMVVTPFP
jgi:hypothetical protein